MRVRGMCGALALGFALGPNAAAATDAETAAALRAMQDRLSAVEDQLQAANAKVEAQEQVIQKAGLPQVGAGEPSKLQSWIDSLQFDGWVSASYWYNFNHFDNDRLVGANTGAIFQSNPFNPDANQFSFDQLWFQMQKPVTPDSPSGFVAEIAYGKIAGLLPLGNAAAGGNSLYIPQAYVQYLTPFGPTIKFGKFSTLIGAEVAGAPYNWQISRGLVYQLLEPIEHTGILASGNIGETGVDYALGVVNDVFKSQPTISNGKAYTGHIGYTQENWSIALNTIYGNVSSSVIGSGDESARRGILNLLFKMTPIEQFSFYVNVDYDWNEDNDSLGGGNGYGVSVAGRYALTEKLGAALRVEYVQDDHFLGFGDQVTFWGLTGTVDYALTDHLTVKGEVRFDQGQADRLPDDLFIGGEGAAFPNHNQTVVGVEAIYRF